MTLFDLPLYLLCLLIYLDNFMQSLCLHKRIILGVYRRTGHNAQYKAWLITKAVKISKYEIDHNCDIKSYCWFTNLIVVRVRTQILSIDNSHHAVLVCNKSYRVTMNTR